MNTKIIGNTRALLGMHGDVDVDKVIEAIKYMAEPDILNIDEINKMSETGLLFITASGRILQTVTKSDESLAKYKIVPIGLKLRYTNYPLFASFIKMQGFWEGAFIGTGIQLFEMYKEHFSGKKDTYNREYETVFGGDNREFNIIGFGLTEVLNNRNVINNGIHINSKDNDQITELTKAIKRVKLSIENETNTKSRRGKNKNSKAQRKAARLEAHLNRLKQNAEKKEKQMIKSTEIRNEKTTVRTHYNSVEEIKWLEIIDFNNVKQYFEDKNTLEFKQRIEKNIEDTSELNNDNQGCVVTKQIKYIEEQCDINDETEAIVNDIVKVADIVAEEKTDTEDDSLHISEDIIKSMDHDYIESTPAEKSKYRIQLKADLVSDVYERLLIKENWRIDNKNRLAFYLKGLFILIDTNRKNNKGNIRGNGYILSKNKSRQIINTGLIDKYGNYIYIIDHTPKIQDFYDKKLTLLNNKSALLDFGFDIMEIRKLPSPIKIVQDNSMFVFKGSIEDFDLEDDYHLNHIIEERRMRFPAKYKNESTKVLCDKLKQAIVQAIKISKIDYKYIVPKYDFYRNTIQFLIPFHLDTNLDEKSELTIVIGNHKGLWQIFTVLYTDDAYDDARLICKPSNDWLKIK